MSLAGYNTKIKITGTATAMSSQAMSIHSTVANTFRINSTARRVWSRTGTLTFRQNSGTTSVSTISNTDISDVDYLFGIVTFNTIKAGTVSVSGNYLPLSNIAGSNTYGLNITRVLQEDTDHTSTGWISRQNSLFDVSLSVGRFDNVDKDFFSLINSGNAAVVEVNPGGTTLAARGFFLVESENRSGDVASLEGSDLSFQLDGDVNASFSFNTP